MRILAHAALWSAFLVPFGIHPGLCADAGTPRARSSTGASQIRKSFAGMHQAPGQKALPERQKQLMQMNEVRQAIREKRLLAGMTEQEVRSAWGWPEFTHPVHGVDTFTDRWTYRRKGEGLVDLYFENGVLTRIVK